MGLVAFVRRLFAGARHARQDLAEFRAQVATGLLALVDAVVHVVYLVLALVLLQNLWLAAAQVAGLALCCAAFALNRRIKKGTRNGITALLTVEICAMALAWTLCLGFGSLMCGFVLCALVPHYLYTEVSDKVRVQLIWTIVVCANAALAIGIFVPPLIQTPHLWVFAAVSFDIVFMVTVLELSINAVGIDIARTAYEGSIADAQDASMTDPLTGLRNRRFLQANAEAYRERSKASPCAVALFDLDFFKQVNDVYGHAAGDALLVHFAGLLRATFRSSDLVLRWGGEEFLVVFTGVPVGKAAEMVEAFRGTAKAAPLSWRGAPIPFSFTAGVCALRGEHAVADAIDNADRLLYAGKTGGRDQVVSQI